LGSPARKPLESSTSRHTTGLPSWLIAQGYTPVPRNFFREVGGRLDYGAFLCLGIVLEETVGKPRPPGTPVPEASEPITEEQFARWTGLTVRGVRQSLDSLERLGVLRCQKRGRAYSYAVVPDRLYSLPDRHPRTLDREPKPAPATAQGLGIALVCPLGSECPVHEVYDGPAGLTNIRQGGEEKTNDTGTRVPVSFASSSPAPNGDLRAMLERTLLAKLHTVPDDQVVRRVAQSLGDAPIRDLEEFILLKSDKVRSWGFVPLLAKDCRATWERLGCPRPYAALLDDLAGATGDAAIDAARKVLTHPSCSPQDQVRLLRIFPGLHWDAHNTGGPNAHPPRAP